MMKVPVKKCPVTEAPTPPSLAQLRSHTLAPPGKRWITVKSFQLCSRYNRTRSDRVTQPPSGTGTGSHSLTFRVVTSCSRTALHNVGVFTSQLVFVWKTRRCTMCVPRCRVAASRPEVSSSLLWFISPAVPTTPGKSTESQQQLNV